jgi:1-deoxyxylulose-5-phosphate synthase
MSNSIKKTSFPKTGRCVVCGQWMPLELWDDGLQGRFCAECFDHVLDAEGLLISEGMAPITSKGVDPLGHAQLVSRMQYGIPIRRFSKPSVKATKVAEQLSKRSVNGRAKHATDIVTLGESDLSVSRLAIGMGGGDWSKQSLEAGEEGGSFLADLLEYGFERGLRFWDSADQEFTHAHIRAALKRVPRDEVTILTKTTSTNAADVLADIERYRCEFETDYIDMVMLHCLTDPEWPRRMRPAMDALSEAKQRGLVRTHGVSCNTLGALRSAASEPWVEVGMARINPAGVLMDSDPDNVLSVLHQMKQAGKGIIGMKIFGAGRLADRIDECLRFVLGQYCVDCFTVGIESKEQLDEILVRTPLNSP